MTARTFEFGGSRGYRLVGKLELPDGQLLSWAILAHCFTCGKDSLAASRLARALASRGVGVLRFDFAGLRNSGGSFADLRTEPHRVQRMSHPARVLEQGARREDA